jgi:hypothetical protein
MLYYNHLGELMKTGIGKTLSTGIVALLILFGAITTFFFPDKIEIYSKFMDTVYPIVATHMAAIFGGNAIKMYNTIKNKQ